MSHENTDNSICCPKFDPAPWDGKVFEWKDKRFIKDSVFTLFYMPINFGSVMKKFDLKVKQAKVDIPDSMCLSNHTSKWNMDVYLAVNKEIQGEKSITFNGTFVSKVYEGSYKETANWQKDFNFWCGTQGYKTVKTFMWYTTCPKCVKKYGKNYVVLVAEIKKI